MAIIDASDLLDRLVAHVAAVLDGSGGQAVFVLPGLPLPDPENPHAGADEEPVVVTLEMFELARDPRHGSTTYAAPEQSDHAAFTAVFSASASVAVTSGHDGGAGGNIYRVPRTLAALDALLSGATLNPAGPARLIVDRCDTAVHYDRDAERGLCAGTLTVRGRAERDSGASVETTPN